MRRIFTLFITLLVMGTLMGCSYSLGVSGHKEVRTEEKSEDSAEAFVQQFVDPEYEKDRPRRDAIRKGIDGVLDVIKKLGMISLYEWDSMGCSVNVVLKNGANINIGVWPLPTGIE